MSGGYIKLYRSILDWEWFGDSKTLSVFVFCLLSANHAQKKWRGIIIEAGQFVTSLQSIHEATHLTQRSIRTALNNLKTTGELTIKTTNKYTLVTVANWALYQSGDDETTSKTTSKTTNERQSNDNQTTTNKNDKNDKKNIYGSFSNVTLTDDELQKLKERFSDWQKKIDDLSAYIASRGKRYASHYATILTWARRDEPSEEVKKKKYVN